MLEELIKYFVTFLNMCLFMYVFGCFNVFYKNIIIFLIVLICQLDIRNSNLSFFSPFLFLAPDAKEPVVKLDHVGQEIATEIKRGDKTGLGITVVGGSDTSVVSKLFSLVFNYLLLVLNLMYMDQ